jgi:hypothetical protein
MSTALRIQDCISNHEKYVAIMATLPDKELAKKLNLVHIQSEIAERTKNTGSLELLEIWHQQIIAARIYKAENEIADAPNEIGLAIAAIETFVTKTEHSQKIMIDFSTADKPIRPKTQQKQDSESQHSLF